MQIRFIEPASIELDDAIEYYELQFRGLGKRFPDEVIETSVMISLFGYISKKFRAYQKSNIKKISFQYHIHFIQ